jgi:putative SbcD/Mre11-related phosphoesterase
MSRQPDVSHGLSMNHTRLQLAPGIVLDARRAVFLEETGVLAVADLHFGYAWTHRARGQILPVSKPDTTLPRLLGLLDEYRPRALALLGDIVHGELLMEENRAELRALLAALRERAEVVLVAGNHDRLLPQLLRIPIPREHRAGRHLLLHGDLANDETAAIHLAAAQAAGGLVIMGHEHPSISMGDGVAHRARVPCFLAGERLLVLPAFSEWAAGANVRAGEFLSPLPRLAPPARAVAILAGKLLALPVG